jgi:predicted glycoside hydrolase/deacetylase ChbG (UPF0249 family)
MTDRRYLIVNADDFGQSPGVNRGIIAAHERGMVTSASLMVRWPAAREAAAYGKAQPRLAVGLHLDLGEWACRDGVWDPLYEVVRVDDGDAVAAELARQLASFRRLMGCDPTHIDSHQHAHRKEPVLGIASALAASLGVPLRSCAPDIFFCGKFYGQTDDGSPLPEIVSVAGLLEILRSLPAGITELSCHPGDADDLNTMYCAERSRELEVLCDPRVRAALPELGIVLCSFKDLRNHSTR